MRYFKIYHNNITVSKAYWEISKDDFDTELGDYAAQNTPDFEDEDGNPDYDACEKAMDEVITKAEKDAKGENGFNMGDYSLYIRDDDSDMYDIPRENR